MKVAELDELFFMKENIVDVNAAAIGTSINKLECIDSEQATHQPKALEMMKTGRYDVLPIKSIKSPNSLIFIKEYFHTDKWNDYSSISRKSIAHKDFIPIKTHIRDVIKSFASEERLFYFLSHENRIAGLVTIADLNHRQVRIYLFSLISELEMLLSKLIDKEIGEERLLNMIYGNKDADIKKRYKEDRENGVQVAFVEYLYLSDLNNIAIKENLHSKLDYTKTKFDEHFGSFNELRKNIAHPTRSIVTDEKSVDKLWKRIDRIEEALFRLRHLDQA